MKAGASNHDKVRIRKLHLVGRSSQQISALTTVQHKHVIAIIKQVDSGTLKLMGGGKTDYGHGDQDGKEPEIEQLAAVKVVEDAKDTEIDALKEQLVTAKEKLAKKPARKAKRRAKPKAKPEPQTE